MFSSMYISLSYLLFQLLEYTGRGKSIIDVGLAQARYPLNTTNHYYEIKIIDPGESCYIAIGLARRVSLIREKSESFIFDQGNLII